MPGESETEKVSYLSLFSMIGKTHRTAGGAGAETEAAGATGAG